MCISFGNRRGETASRLPQWISSRFIPVSRKRTDEGEEKGHTHSPEEHVSKIAGIISSHFPLATSQLHGHS